MNNDKPNPHPHDVFKQLEEIRAELRKRFIHVEDYNDLPPGYGGSMLEKIYADPTEVFYFLEFLFDKEYVDLLEQGEIHPIDDKTTWNFFLMSENGFLSIYDWKGYSVSVGFIGKDNLSSVSDELKEDAKYITNLIKEKTKHFWDFKKTQSKTRLEQDPLNNFIAAFMSLCYLFNLSVAKNKSDDYGYIESLILLVSLVDTELRYAILLTRINNRKSEWIDEDLRELFRQQDDRNYISERAIFRMAKQELVFRSYDKELFFERANKLYDKRNRAVHRYAITSFQYQESKEAVEEYKDLPKIAGDVIEVLEQEQAKLGVGFINAESLRPKTDKEMKKAMHTILENKVDPSAIYHEKPYKEAMFSDKYPNGINPKYKDIVKEILRNSSQH